MPPLAELRSAGAWCAISLYFTTSVTSKQVEEWRAAKGREIIYINIKNIQQHSRQQGTTTARFQQQICSCNLLLSFVLPYGCDLVYHNSLD